MRRRQEIDAVASELNEKHSAGGFPNAPKDFMEEATIVVDRYWPVVEAASNVWAHCGKGSVEGLPELERALEKFKPSAPETLRS